MSNQTQKKRRPRLVDQADFWGDQYGQAAIEFVVCVPILLMILLGMGWVQEYHDFQQDAIMQARNDTFQRVVDLTRTGGSDSDEFSIALIDNFGSLAGSLSGILTIRNSMMLGPLLFPDMPTMSGGKRTPDNDWDDPSTKGNCSVTLGLAELALILNGSPMTPYGTAELNVDNYFKTSGSGAFGHTNSWNNIFFAMLFLYDDTFGNDRYSTSFSEQASITFPAENYPIITDAWESINHSSHTWTNSYNLMKDHIHPLEISGAIRIGSFDVGMAGFGWLDGWQLITVNRAPRYKFNRPNFDFNMHNPNGGGSGYPSVSGGIGLAFDWDSPYIAGDPRIIASPPDEAFNPLIRITGQSNVREVIR
ncbi:pilus assembly protein [Candidatus Sumerlaeota bacterium]|nr:pilus assembly protein [Candidatus Sumerlaeota bacterium]